jgi:hypothetical protein
VASKLGYRLRATGKKQVGVAVKKLERPITGSTTFRTSIKGVKGGDGLLSNGYLAFGSKANDSSLIKCGVRLKSENASIVQGPLLKGKVKSVEINIPDDKVLEIVVRVDLKSQKIVYTVDGVTIEAVIQKPLKSITHAGYAIDSALIDFAPVEIH